MKRVFVLIIVLVFFASNYELLPQSRQVKVTKKNRRVALVIGNGEYKNSPLRNPVNDATDMADALKKCGFKVNLQQDASKKTMEDSIREFGENIKNGEVGLFYYAGHGIQVKGINFLIPVDSEIQAEDEIEYKAVDAGFVLSKMDSANNKMNIIILDACRDNPFARSFRSASKGLARMDAPQGSLIVYATSPGETAADGKGRNGIFTKNFLNEIKGANFEIMHLLRNVRKNVIEETGNKQIPWESSSLVGNFYFSYTDTQYEKVVTEISKLESQLKELEKQKMEAEKLKKEKEIREATRKTEDLKVKLKARQLEQERLAKEKERKEKLEEEAKQIELLESQKQEKLAQKKAAEEARLNELRKKFAKEQAEIKDIKKEVVSLEKARKEVALLESKIDKVNALISSEKEEALNRLTKDYKRTKGKLNKPIPPKDQFETTADYNARIKQHQKKIKALEDRYWANYHAVQKKYDNEIQSSTEVYRDQIAELKNIKYPVNGLKIELLRYNADKEMYKTKLTDLKGNIWIYSLSIEPKKAKGLNKREGLLNVQAYFEGPDQKNSFSSASLIDPILGRLPLESGIKVKTIKLRSKYKKLREKSVISMFKRRGFFESYKNKTGEFNNNFELCVINGDKVVIDSTTGLMWHQSGSSERMTFKKAKKWIINLNESGYAGYHDWRLPTLEEGASLLENSRINNNLHIARIFSSRQSEIWTGDKSSSDKAWIVSFRPGGVWDITFSNDRTVRPVRTAY